MNDALRELFRHNAWATRELLAFCEDLSDEQLGASGTGSFGTILEALNHIVWPDANYLRTLTGNEPDWLKGGETDNLKELSARVDESEDRWNRFLSDPVDADRVLLVDDGENAVRAGVIIAQAIHHGNHHREQICAMLTGLGFEPPDIQAWEYGWKTGRLWAMNGGQER